MKKGIINIWYNLSLTTARFTIYIALALLYIFLRVYPLKISETHICPLCGMTRATTCLLQFKIYEAYNYNNKVIFILLLMIFIIFDIMGFILNHLKNKFEPSGS